MSTEYNIDCPICNYPYASHYKEKSGEADQHCELCGYHEDVSDYKMDYFDSEDDWANAQAEVEVSKPTLPSDDIKREAIKISKLVNLLDAEDTDLTYDLRDFIYRNSNWKTYEGMFQAFLKYERDNAIKLLGMIFGSHL